MVKVTLVNADDWQALYIDDKLRYENHSISAKDALGMVAGMNFYFENVYVDEDWFYDNVNLPENLSEVVLFP